jgi:flagellar hook-associated protein 1 FlgK
MSDLLSIGLSGLSAYRSALSAVGDNVSNAETPGFARRSVRLGEAGSGGSGSIGEGEGIAFSGVKANAVIRAWDDFKAADARLSASVASRALTRQQWLTAVESALSETAGGVGALVGDFFNAGVSLAANPGDVLSRSAMLAALDEAAGAIRNAGDALIRVADGIGTAAQLEVEALNADLAALAEVNLAVRQAEPGRSSRASLEDERDRLIDSISAKIDVTTAIGNDGTAILTLAADTGVTLLDMNTRALISVAPAADGRLSLQLRANGVAAPLPANGGSLAGLVGVSATTADQRIELDAMAAQFVSSINNWSAAGLDKNGNPGAALLGITAGASTVRLLTTDPAAIAAAAPGGAENGNLLDLPGLRDANGFEARWAALVTSQAQTLAAARAEAAAASTRRDNSFAARDETAGIDLDREAADLMRYQQAYGASAKIIQVARETLQSILDLF